MRPKTVKKPVRPGAEETKEVNPFSVLHVTPGQSLRSEEVNDLMQGLYNYRFNAQMTLESSAGTGFQFDGDLHYAALGSYVAAYVHCMLAELCNLTDVWLPPQRSEQICVMQSQDWGTNTEKAMVIIPGKGKVDLGQWSRNICINEGLIAGSMINYVIRALGEGYAVLIMNCNARTSSIKSNEDNALMTWKACMPQSRARDVYIVGHSWGGKCTIHLLKTNFSDLSRRVLGIAFTDSVHKTVIDLPAPAREFLKSRAVNWVKSQRPLDEVVSDKNRAKDGCENRSSGTTVHEYTSGCAIDCVFSYLQSRVRRAPLRPGLRPK